MTDLELTCAFSCSCFFNYYFGRFLFFFLPFAANKDCHLLCEKITVTTINKTQQQISVVDAAAAAAAAAGGVDRWRNS